MTDTNARPADELGTPVGPQAAAQEALKVEIDGREPPPGAEQPGAQGPSEETWDQVLYNLLRIGFKLAESRWPKMGATDEEVAALTEALVPVAHKYAGAAVSIEFVAVAASVAIVGPKVIATLVDAKKQQRTAAEEARQEPRDATTTHV